ncbi:hypothetical protein [Hyphomicrobium sp. D-2]|uniref:hypothetical protein n=1 Tax=Hyphomicrobium sp. D-2 TaxID=3041621 RepID=UPI002458C035|nr:hypothetical protein [Hyphomicrobium sp. D-2]MDH4981288.1 hypothetical protein [Hyphomicrobium sp. D-2]
MPMKLFNAIRNANWLFILAVPVAAGILHICATMAAPYLTAASAYNRLAPGLPVNSMQVLSVAAPGSEPLPFMSPDARYAMCSFDARGGPIDVSATLPADQGWSLSVVTPAGDNIYAAASVPSRPTPITLVLVPSEDAFLGVTPEARGIARNIQPPTPLSASRGIVVMRAPDKGFAYTPHVETLLRDAKCVARPF